MPSSPLPSPNVIMPVKGIPEAVYRQNVPLFNLEHVNVVGGTTSVRLDRCDGFRLLDVRVGGMTGPADPDGHGIQIINCGGIIDHPIVIANGRTEDHINIYGDDPENVNRVVHIICPALYGRGLSLSGNGICIDGPCPPKVVVTGAKFVGNRCGFTIAAGYGHSITGSTTYACDTDGYIQNDPNYEKLPHFVPIGGLYINNGGFKKGVLVPSLPIPFPKSVITGAYAA